jgi:hypothetical protein
MYCQKTELTNNWTGTYLQRVVVCKICTNPSGADEDLGYWYSQHSINRIDIFVWTITFDVAVYLVQADDDIVGSNRPIVCSWRNGYIIGGG